ncbi:MAG: DUF397 domain-containing protein [Patescibacteria group bacterium]
MPVCIIGLCVQAASEEGGKVLIRKSTDPKAVVTVSKEEWDSFIEGVKNGDFDKV